MKKPAPDLHAMHHRVWQHLHPEQGEAELGRADALEVRHGLCSELDERWSSVRSKAHPRW
jgi:hypothetical protein